MDVHLPPRTSGSNTSVARGTARLRPQRRDPRTARGPGVRRSRPIGPVRPRPLVARSPSARPTRRWARPTTVARARSTGAPRRAARAPRSRRSRAAPTAASRDPRCAAVGAAARRQLMLDLLGHRLHLARIATAGDHEVTRDREHVADVEDQGLLVRLRRGGRGRGRHPSTSSALVDDAPSTTGRPGRPARRHGRRPRRRQRRVLGLRLVQRIGAEHHGDVDRVVGIRVHQHGAEAERIAQLLAAVPLASEDTTKVGLRLPEALGVPIPSIWAPSPARFCAAARP